MSKSWINTPESIEKYVKRGSNSFSFVDTIGSFVKNSRFKKGYIDLKQENVTEESYFWTALSAIGQDIGDTIYSNVVNYIDNASNIDVCKIKALQSMMDLYGIDYKLLDEYNKMPVEIQNLIDILSYNRNYLVKSNVLNKIVESNLKNSTKSEKENKKDCQISSNYLNVLHGFRLKNVDNRYSNPFINKMFKLYALIHDFDYSSNDCYIPTDEYLSSFNFNRIYVSEDYELGEQDYFTLEKFNLISSIDPSCTKFYGFFYNNQDLPGGKKLVSLIPNFESIVNYLSEDEITYDNLFENTKLDKLYEIFNTNNYISSVSFADELISSANEIENFDFDTSGQKKINYLIETHIKKLNFNQDLNQFYFITKKPTGENQIILDAWNTQISDLLSTVASIKKPIEQIQNKIAAISSITYDNIPNDFENGDIFRLMYLCPNPVEFEYEWFDDSKYLSYIKDMYFNMISGMCSLKYLQGTQSPSGLYEAPIYCSISSDLILSNTTSNFNFETKFEKTLSGVDVAFDEVSIADAIDQGLDSIDNYVGAAKTLIENEISKRNLPLSSDENNYRSRTSYYREQKVKEYFKFVQDEYYGKRIFTKDQAYEYNDDYIEIDMVRSQYKYLLSVKNDGYNDIIGIDLSMIEMVADNLAELTIYIQRLRDKLKIQSQKYYMKGTFNLLSYAINEYLIEFSKLNYELNHLTLKDGQLKDENGNIVQLPLDLEINKYIDGYDTLSSYTDLSNLYTQEELYNQYNNVDLALKTVHDKLKNHSFDNIKQIEYDDITEYFNISTDKNQYDTQINKRFWEDESVTGGFKMAITANEIENFYLKTLKMNNNNLHSNSLSSNLSSSSEIDKFLSALYNVGANEDSITKNNEIKLLVNNKDDNNSIEQHKTLFLNFIGNKYGYSPYYNMKNIHHPSYQIHPYLKQFVEATNSVYLIKNSFESGLTKQLIYKSALKLMEQHVGEFGQTINMWNNIFDFSGYKDNYEIVNHNEQTNELNKYNLHGYSGAFFPPAIEDFTKYYFENRLSDFVNDISSRNLSSDDTIYSKYYKHLNLSDLDLQYQCESIYEYADKLTAITELKETKYDVYDIFKFGTDKYENEYILYKKYPSQDINISVKDQVFFQERDIPFSTKEDTLGQLWIRLKDHPFAFPAFSGKHPVVSLRKTKVNGKIINLRDASKLSSTTVEGLSVTYDEYEKTQMDDYIILDDLCCFFDIEFDYSKRTLFAVTYPKNEPNEVYKNYYKLRPYCRKRHQFGEVLILNLDQDEDPLTNKAHLHMTDDEVIRYDTFPNQSFYKLSSDNVVRSFIGFYKDPSKTGAVYIDKEIKNKSIDVFQVKSESGDIIEEYDYISSEELGLHKNELSVSIQFYGWHDKETTRPLSKVLNIVDFKQNVKYLSYEFTDDVVRFNHNGDDLVFAALTKLNSPIQVNSYIGQISENNKFVFPNDTSGYVEDLAAIYEEGQDEPLFETNSLDGFDKFVTVLDAKLKQEDISLQEVTVHNLNSDASYIPIYPGKDGKVDVWKSKKYNDEIYTSYELLGFSKNINHLTSQLDVSSDLNYDIDQLVSDTMEGRIFEDNSLEEINNYSPIQEFRNPGLFSNGPNDFVTFFQWNQSLSSFDKRNLSGLQMIFVNTENNGKNAYYIGSFGEIISATNNSEISGFLAPGYISSDIDEDVKLSIDTIETRVGGTFSDYNGGVNSSDTNHLKNIKEIILSYDEENQNLKIIFNKTDKNKRCHVSTNQLKLIIYDTTDLRIYKFFHYIDEAGIIKYDLLPGTTIDDYTNEELLNRRYIEYKEPQKRTDWSTFGAELADKQNQFFGERQQDISSMMNDLPYLIDETLSVTRYPLSTMTSLDDLDYLSAHPLLSGYYNLAFKYDEEAVFEGTDKRFYYPGRNCAFPIINEQRFYGNEDNIINLRNIFNERNMFILQLENSKTFADKIGQVNIPLQENDTDYLRVYEDYDETLKLDDSLILSSLHICTTDTNEFYISSDTDTEIKFPIVNIPNPLIDKNIDPDEYELFMSYGYDIESLDRFVSTTEVLNHLGWYGLHQLNAEELSSDYEFESIVIDVNSSNTDLKDLLNIYIYYTYEKDKTITLYFNYYNYMYTPFILFNQDTGINKPDIIEGSYLKLKAGEEGILDLDVQFKAYYGNNIYGYRTGKLVSYKIFNVSDDKPKFVIYKINEIVKNSLGTINVTADDSSVQLQTRGNYIDLDDDSIEANDLIEFTIPIYITSINKINTMEFQMKFDPIELTFISVNDDVFDYEIIDDKNGLIQFTSKTNIEAFNTASMVVSFKTAYTKKQITESKISNYNIRIQSAYAYDLNENELDILTYDAQVIFGYQILLRPEEFKSIAKNEIYTEDDLFVTEDKFSGDGPNTNKRNIIVSKHY